ncbi:MAG: hypothetical protein ACRC4W_02735 [Treponemataceae bacterium]
MSVRALRKFCILLPIYAAIITILLVIQFKKNSFTTKSIGTMQFQIQEKVDENGVEKKNFLLAFRDFTFFSDDETPVMLAITNDLSETATLKAVNSSSSSIVLFFENHISISFITSNSLGNNTLEISTSFPDHFEKIYIPYRINDTQSTLELLDDYSIAMSRKTQYVINSNQIAQAKFVLDTDKKIIISAEEIQKQTLSDFEKAVLQKGSAQLAYNTLTDKIKSSFLEYFTRQVASSNNEKDIVTFIAQMAAQNQYEQALSAVNPSFLTAGKNTYFSMPYFNNLVSMNRSMMNQQDSIIANIQYLLTNNDLSVFEIEFMPLLLIQKGQFELLRKVINLPTELEDFDPTLGQALGIVHAYSILKENYSQLVQGFAIILEKSFDTILEHLAFGESLVFFDNSIISTIVSSQSMPQFISRASRILIDFGQSTHNEAIIQTGYMVFVSYFDNFANFSQVPEIYPYITNKKSFYPKTTFLNNSLTFPVTAWSAAENITYKLENKEAIISISFIEGSSHYVIINGITPFDKIEIYGLAYRSDPRFESYNSSGYVYDEQSQTLFLKVRHKEKIEHIKLYYANANPAPEFIMKN